MPDRGPILAEPALDPATLINARLSDVVRALTRSLAQAGVSEPALDARLLVMRACGLSHAELISNSGGPIGDDAAVRLAALGARRLAREPLARIFGAREFWGREFAIGPATLEPRPDTETLVGAVMEAVRARGMQADRLMILDIGTGSGCILISLLGELPLARGLGTDISLAALDVAMANAARHGMQSRCHFVQTSWFSGVAGPFDLILANPPYVESCELHSLAPEVRCHDPVGALDGGADGLEAYRAIIPGLASRLAPGGLVAFEVGKGQAPAVGAMLDQAGLNGAHAAVIRDLAGIERVVLADLSDCS